MIPSGSSKLQRGLSLVELVVGMGLFGLLAMSVGLLVRNGLQYLRDGETRAEVARRGLSVLSQITREVSETDADTIRLYSPGSEPPGLVFASPRSASNELVFVNGKLQWRRWVCFYWTESNQRLIRVAEDLTPPTTFVPDPSSAGLNCSVASMVASTSSSRLLAKSVSDFQVSGKKQVDLQLEIQSGTGDRTFKLLTRTTVVPRQ